MAKTYSELLTDPRWQKKRLEILERDNWCCQICGDAETTLHVHHSRYEKGNKPWEYHDDTLITLCKHCHFITENEKWRGSVVGVEIGHSEDVRFYTVFILLFDLSWVVAIYEISQKINPKYIIGISGKSITNFYNRIKPV